MYKITLKTDETRIVSKTDIEDLDDAWLSSMSSKQEKELRERFYYLDDYTEFRLELFKYFLKIKSWERIEDVQDGDVI